MCSFACSCYLPVHRSSEAHYFTLPANIPFSLRFLFSPLFFGPSLPVCTLTTQRATHVYTEYRRVYQFQEVCTQALSGDSSSAAEKAEDRCSTSFTYPSLSYPLFWVELAGSSSRGTVSMFRPPAGAPCVPLIHVSLSCVPPSHVAMGSRCSSRGTVSLFRPSAAAPRLSLISQWAREDRRCPLWFLLHLPFQVWQHRVINTLMACYET